MVDEVVEDVDVGSVVEVVDVVEVAVVLEVVVEEVVVAEVVTSSGPPVSELAGADGMSVVPAANTTKALNATQPQRRRNGLGSGIDSPIPEIST